MVSFGNFARIASPCVGFHFGTLHCCFFPKYFLAEFEFSARTKINLEIIFGSSSGFIVIFFVSLYSFWPPCLLYLYTILPSVWNLEIDLIKQDIQKG